MSRSKWKIPFIQESLLEKSLKLKNNKKIKLKKGNLKANGSFYFKKVDKE